MYVHATTTMWPPAFLCECFAGDLPSVAEVLGAVQTQQAVCTQTQCFESEADAFGLVAPAPVAPTLPLWGVAALAFLALAALTRPSASK